MEWNHTKSIISYNCRRKLRKYVCVYEAYLVEKKSKKTVHVGPQEVRTETKHPQRETRFGYLMEPL